MPHFYFSSSSFGSKYLDGRAGVAGVRLFCSRAVAFTYYALNLSRSAAENVPCTVEARDQFPWNSNVFSFTLYSAICGDAASCSRRSRWHQTRAVFCKSGSGGRAGRLVPRLQVPIAVCVADHYPPSVSNSGAVIAGRNVCGIIKKNNGP